MSDKNLLLPAFYYIALYKESLNSDGQQLTQYKQKYISKTNNHISLQLIVWYVPHPTFRWINNKYCFLSLFLVGHSELRSRGTV